MKNDYSYENFQKRREEIKRNKNGEEKTPLELFVYTFGAVLLSFLVIATIISPNLNIPALNDDEKSVQDMGSSDFKSRVDYRLQEIKLNDTTPNQAQALPQQETASQLQTAMDKANTLVKAELPTFGAPQLPNKNSNTQTTVTPNFSQQVKKPSQALQASPVKAQTGQTPAPYIPKTAAQSNRNYKILVGDYASPEDAQRIADMLSASNPSARPIIKSHNGAYSVQVGAYTDVQKAQNIAGAYRAKNYKVNIIEN